MTLIATFRHTPRPSSKGTEGGWITSRIRVYRIKPYCTVLNPTAQWKRGIKCSLFYFQSKSSSNLYILPSEIISCLHVQSWVATSTQFRNGSFYIRHVSSHLDHLSNVALGACVFRGVLDPHQNDEEQIVPQVVLFLDVLLKCHCFVIKLISLQT